jgi:hypothetical protein
MEAIRRFVTVKDHTINIILPDDFNADEVEVIILPLHTYQGSIPKWQMDQVKERSEEYSKNPAMGQDFDDAIKDIQNGL